MPPSDDAMPAALDSLIAEAQMSCAEPASETLHAIRDRLAQPLRVAVVGRVSSGKSTLVNALLGVRAAPTGAGAWALVEAATMPGAPPWLADRVRPWQLASDGAVAER